MGPEKALDGNLMTCLKTKTVNDPKQLSVYYPWWSVDTENIDTALSWARIMSDSFDYEHLVIGMSKRLPGNDWPNTGSLDFKPCYDYVSRNKTKQVDLTCEQVSKGQYLLLYAPYRPFLKICEILAYTNSASLQDIAKRESKQPRKSLQKLLEGIVISKEKSEDNESSNLITEEALLRNNNNFIKSMNEGDENINRIFMTKSLLNNRGDDVHGAILAIDGLLSTCSLTINTNPMWAVELGRIITIERVLIVNNDNSLKNINVNLTQRIPIRNIQFSKRCFVKNVTSKQQISFVNETCQRENGEYPSDLNKTNNQLNEWKNKWEYENLATNTVTYQSSTHGGLKALNLYSFYGPKNAIDGLERTCAKTSELATVYKIWWAADMRRVQEIDRVVIVGEDVGSFKELTVGVSKRLPKDNQWKKIRMDRCFHFRNVSGSKFIINNCERPISGRYFIITSEKTPLKICELAVYSRLTNFTGLNLFK
ncbi:DgyrCDS5496 [Dimorphilus gyrociliatus]|uniref:DgyrCDS5496 n=1 Tax=Dimorphilus gyrociliatus TaxID=2664684 RepID=A0A7I8VLP7_9ANNE|nr:DgyrCDS5496 [Dimorphilus gyrociliatus]